MDTEADAFETARRFLSYLPSSVHELPERVVGGDSPVRREESLLSIVPTDGKTPYQPRKIVEASVDTGSFFEIGHDWGRGIVCGFARLDGYPVGILAGDPFFLDGAWTADVCDKVTRHMDLCSQFHLPVVHFVDCPGFAVGVKAETAGVTRAGVRAMTAIYQADVTEGQLEEQVVYVAEGVDRPVYMRDRRIFKCSRYYQQGISILKCI